MAIPTWKIAPGLAYGNAVLFKPASAAVATATRLVELARPAIPDDVLTLMTISGADANALIDDPRVAGVSFTGSSETGWSIISRAASRGAAVQAELGGQNAAIVLPDADLDLAAATIAGAAMGYSGQKCTATRRVVVDRRIAESFVPKLTRAIESLVLGDPAAESTDVGPVISRTARDSVASAISEAVARGARVRAGGPVPAGAGWFCVPSLLEIEDRRDPFVHEETFGPALAVLVSDGDHDAIEVANSTRYGLAASVFSEDQARAERVGEALNVGMLRINGSTTGADFWAPFGGERASGYGPREQGNEARQFLTRTQTISIFESSR